MTITRRELVRRSLFAAAGLALPVPLSACTDALEETEKGAPAGSEIPPEASPYDPPSPADAGRLAEWVGTVREEGLDRPEVPLGSAAARVGELAGGTPYEAFTLEAYLKAGGSPVRAEPLTLHLDRFDCVSLVEACLAVARVARSPGAPEWDSFAREMERMRYRGGVREGYLSRLHYFSEWLDDNERRGLVRSLGEELGGVADTRPLRFMSRNRDAYPALAHPEVYSELQERERGLDANPRWVIPRERIPQVSDRIETGDVLAFSTSIEGLDVTHAAFAYRDAGGVLRVLHAPLSGGEVEVTASTLPQYVAAIRRSTGILVARPLQG